MQHKSSAIKKAQPDVVPIRLRKSPAIGSPCGTLTRRTCLQYQLIRSAGHKISTSLTVARPVTGRALKSLNRSRTFFDSSGGIAIHVPSEAVSWPTKYSKAQVSLA